MIKAKIIIGDSHEKSRRFLKEILRRHGYNIVADVSNAPELLRKTRVLFPDLVIVAGDIEGGSINEIAGIIEYDDLSNVLIMTDGFKASSLDYFPHLIKPFSEDTFLSVVEVCLLYSQRFGSMKKEILKLQESLNNRKVIEKAKGILITTTGITEEEAYHSMRKLSMDKSMSMIEIARAIINSQS